MKNLLKMLGTTKQETETLIVEKPKVDWQKINNGDRSGLFSRPKTTEELIQEIHDTFYTEVDRLLEYAKIQKPIAKTEEEDALVIKAEKLKSLGFRQTKEVEKSNEILRKENIAKEENEKKAKLIETINYFSTKYPQYKFITEDSVKKICEKYNLIYGIVERYKGAVPDKNLLEIQKFQIDENDACYQEKSAIAQFGYFTDDCIFFDKKEYDLKINSQAKQISDKIYSAWYYANVMRASRFSKSPLEIAAPISDFDMNGVEVKDNKIVAKAIKIPDPIVLQPVFHNGQKHYLIVTAWGLEASDELVVNQNMN